MRATLTIFSDPKIELLSTCDWPLLFDQNRSTNRQCDRGLSGKFWKRNNECTRKRATQKCPKCGWPTTGVCEMIVARGPMISKGLGP